MMFLIIILSKHMNICELYNTAMSFTKENLYTLWILFSVERIQFLEETLHLNTSDPELPGNPRNTFFYIYYLFSHNFVTS